MNFKELNLTSAASTAATQATSPVASTGAANYKNIGIATNANYRTNNVGDANFTTICEDTTAADVMIEAPSTAITDTYTNVKFLFRTIISTKIIRVKNTLWLSSTMLQSNNPSTMLQSNDWLVIIGKHCKKKRRKDQPASRSAQQTINGYLTLRGQLD